MKKAYIFPILILVAVAIGVYFILPKYEDFNNLKEKVEGKKQELEEKKVYFSNLEKIFQKAKEKEESLNKIKQALPQEVSLSSLLSFFQKEASENGLAVVNIAPSESSSQKKQAGTGEESEEEERIKESYFQVGVEGSLENFSSFLSNLENSSRLLEVENISLRAKQKQESLLEITLSLKVHSY